jgi:hypothetical protein
VNVLSVSLASVVLAAMVSISPAAHAQQITLGSLGPSHACLPGEPIVLYHFHGRVEAHPQRLPAGEWVCYRHLTGEHAYLREPEHYEVPDMPANTPSENSYEYSPQYMPQPNYGGYQSPDAYVTSWWNNSIRSHATHCEPVGDGRYCIPRN